MTDMTVSAGRGVFLLLHQSLGMGPLKITLIFLRMAFFTSFVIVEEGGGLTKEFWIGMFYPFFFDV